MKKGRLFLCIVTCSVLLSSLAFANGLNLNSLGTKALTMGGAFVGLADDFSTIYWNPAGIAQFNKQHFGFYGTDIIPSTKYKMDALVPGIGSVTLVNAKNPTKHYLAGLVAYYHPITENLVAGIGVYAPSGLGAEWDGEDFMSVSMNTAYEWSSKIGMVTISPALAYRVNEQFFIGAALNINYGMFNVKTHAGSQDLGVDIGQYDESLDGWGYGATFGILFKPTETLSVGATFRTASTISFSGDITISKINILGQIPGSPLFGADIPTTTSVEREVTWPLWIAGGVAFRPTEKLTLTADVQWTKWSEIEVMKTTYSHPLWALIVDEERPMHWDDAAQIRFGAEYKLNSLAIRGGYYWDPSPAPDRTMNVLLPNYDFNVFTVGLGYNLNGLQIDFGFEYLRGKERDVPFEKVALNPEWETAMPGIYKNSIVVPNISVSYQF